MITLYSKPDCPHCDQAKKYLETHNIDFETINVMENVDALMFLKGQGHKTVPQLYVGDTLLINGGNAPLQKHSPETIKEMVKELIT